VNDQTFNVVFSVDAGAAGASVAAGAAGASVASAAAGAAGASVAAGVAVAQADKTILAIIRMLTSNKIDFFIILFLPEFL
jgi:hypothetical protein